MEFVSKSPVRTVTQMSNRPILTDAGWWKTVARMRGPCRACFHQESASEAKVELMVTNITEKSTAGTVGD